MAEGTAATSSASASGFGAGSQELLAEVLALALVLRRRWRIIAVTTLVCMTFAILYLAQARRYYQASSRVLILQQGGRPLNVGGNDAVQLTGGTDDLLATHGVIVASPVVVGRAISSIGLENLPTLAGVKDPVKEAINLLKASRPDRMARILEISYMAFSREEATRMVEAVTASYQKFLEDTYQRSSSEIVSLISRARDDLSRELVELETEYMQVREKSQVPVMDRMGDSYLSRRLDQWDRAVTETSVKSILLKGQLDLGKKLAGGGTELWAIAHAISQLGGDASSLTATVSARSTYNGAADYVRQLEQEQQQLAERYGPHFSKVQELQGQITRIKDRTRTTRSRMEDSETQDLLGAIEQSLESVQQMRKALLAGFDHDRQEVKKIELDLLNEESLRDKVERHRALFNTVVDQLKQAQFISDFTSISSEIIEPANALAYAVRPRLTLTLALALLCSGFLGAGIAIVVDRLDQKIRTIEELRRIIELPVLGMIPRASATDIPADGEMGLVGWTMPHSAWAEAYRALRTNLEFLRRNRKIQVLLITSPHTRDGKSTTASNLAMSQALLGRRVLLVDGDLRKPSQHLIHGLPLGDGLSTVLQGILPVQQVVRRTAVENLDLMTTGPQVPNPAELLMSEGMKKFRDEVRRDYDLVVVDSSPILAVTDPAIIGASADAVLLVASISHLQHREAERTIELLRSMSTPILGVVINGINQDVEEYGYGYGRGYPYGASAGTAPVQNQPRSGSHDIVTTSNTASHENGHAGTKRLS